MEAYVCTLPVLPPNIVADSSLASLSTDRRYEVAVSPEFTAPQHLLHLWRLCEDGSCGQALHDARDLRRGVRWHRLDEKVDMVTVGPDLKEVHLVSFRYLFTGLHYDHVHFLVYHHAPVLGRTHEVIQENADIMGFVEEDAHSASVPRLFCPRQ